MTPTPKLRFVERKVYVSVPERNFYGQDCTISKLVKKTILQQWWEDASGDLADGVTSYGEWRDVPLEAE